MKVSFNKINITPNYNCTMAGYGRTTPSIGVLDPIEINTFIIQVASEITIFSVLDSIMIDESFANKIQTYFYNKFNIPKENIVISAIHTHSAPAFFKLPFENTQVDFQLQNIALDKMIESISTAIATLEDVTLKFSKCLINGVYGNRNEIDGYSDKNVYIFDFINKKNNLIGSFINISLHPTILNGNNHYLSADIIGAIRNKLQNTKQAPVVITNGTCGDVSTRFYRSDSSADEVNAVSNKILNQLIDLRYITFFDFKTLKTSYIFMQSHFDAKVDDFNNSKIIELEKKILTSSDNEKDYLKMLLFRLKYKNSISPFIVNLISNIFVLDNFIFITLPGDVVSKLGKKIKDSFPDYEIILICYSNTYSSYLVDKSDYGKYFETYNSRVSRGEADIFIDRIINTINNIIES